MFLTDSRPRLTKFISLIYLEKKIRKRNQLILLKNIKEKVSKRLILLIQQI